MSTHGTVSIGSEGRGKAETLGVLWKQERRQIGEENNKSSTPPHRLLHRRASEDVIAKVLKYDQHPGRLLGEKARLEEEVKKDLLYDKK